MRPYVLALVTLALVSAATATMLVASPSIATAQAAATPTAEQRARAREAYTRGQQLFDAGRFEEAQASFEAAYQQVANPVVLLGVASAQERRGLRAEARQTLEQYLRERPDAPDRATVQARIAELPATATTTTTGAGATTTTTTGAGTTGGTTTTTTGTATGTTSGTTTTTTGTATGTTTTTTTGTTTTTTTTGTDTASATGPDTDTASDTDTDADSAAEEDGASEPVTGPANAGEGGPSTAVWVLAAVGAVGLVSGTVFGFMALSRQSDFDAMPTLAAADEGEAFALVADISFGVALAGGIAAIVLYATEPAPSDAADTSASLRLLPSASPQGGGLTLLGRF